jgi:hypothetical protein
MEAEQRKCTSTEHENGEDDRETREVKNSRSYRSKSVVSFDFYRGALPGAQPRGTPPISLRRRHMGWHK